MKNKINQEDIFALIAVGCLSLIGFGGCLVFLIAVLFSRLLLIYGAFFHNWYEAFDSTLIAVIGWIFAPWTSLAWIYIYHNNNGEMSVESIILISLAILFDYFNLKRNNINNK